MNLPILKELPKTKKEKYVENTRLFWEKISLEKIDPLNTSEGLERIARSIELLSQIDTKHSKCIDLGCGTGFIASCLSDAKVTLVDVVDHCKQNITASCLPYLKFPEESFDGVILTDVLAEIDSSLHRLTLSECAALLKRDGWFLCSTPLDLYSHDPCGHFLNLLETEFEIQETKKSYHRIYFYVRRWFEGPERFVRAAKHPEYRIKQLEKRSGFFRVWFYCHSTPLLSLFWRPISHLIAPLKKRVLKGRHLLLFFEKVSQWVFRERGLTHIIVLAHKKKI